MLTFDRMTLGKTARELGFVRDTFEKVCRLTEVLRFIQNDWLLADNLAMIVFVRKINNIKNKMTAGFSMRRHVFIPGKIYEFGKICEMDFLLETVEGLCYYHTRRRD